MSNILDIIYLTHKNKKSNIGHRDRVVILFVLVVLGWAVYHEGIKLMVAMTTSPIAQPISRLVHPIENIAVNHEAGDIKNSSSITIFRLNLFKTAGVLNGGRELIVGGSTRYNRISCDLDKFPIPGLAGQRFYRWDEFDFSSNSPNEGWVLPQF
jgi:hypothetical protein